MTTVTPSPPWTGPPREGLPVIVVVGPHEHQGHIFPGDAPNGGAITHTQLNEIIIPTEAQVQLPVKNF